MHITHSMNLKLYSLYILYSNSLAIQIHYNDEFHWVTSTYNSQEVHLYDSFASSNFASSLEIQLVQIYQAAAKDGGLNIKQMPVQQQVNSRDCGVYSIAFAYHAALGSDLSSLNLDNRKMRKHLIDDCFDKEELSPFPTICDDISLNRCNIKNIFIPLYCICGLPELYDDKMIQCITCDQWYHFKCINMKKIDPEYWKCSKCI